MKAIWVGVALIVLVAGVAFSRPEIRNWADQQFPALGINGKGAKEHVAIGDASIATGGSFNSPRIVNIDAQGSVLPGLNEQEGNQTLPGISPLPPSLPTLPQQSASSGNFAPATPTNFQAIPGIGTAPHAANAPTRTADGRLIAQHATLDFVRKIDVVAQADGILTELLVDEGTYVKAGQPLLKLDSRIAEAEVMVQTRELEQAKLKAGNTAQIDYSKAAFEKAKVDVEISAQLVAKRSEDDSTYRAKLLERKKAELQIQVSEIEHAQEEAAVSVSEAKLAAANVQIALRSVTSPWDGFVSEVAKHQNSYVRSGEIVFTMCDLSKMRVKGNVATDIPPHLLFGAAATVRIAIAPNVEKEIQGIVGYVPYETKSGTDYPVWVEIPNEQLPDGQFLFRKGMKATLIIQPVRQ